MDLGSYSIVFQIENEGSVSFVTKSLLVQGSLNSVIDSAISQTN